LQNLLPIGSQITVTTQYNLPNVKPRTVTGTVLPRPRWLQPNEIAVSNPYHLDGMSVINLNRVVNLRDAQGRKIDFTMPDVSDRTWTVQGSKGKVYQVVRKSGAVKCSCPGFQFRRNCRHILEVA